MDSTQKTNKLDILSLIGLGVVLLVTSQCIIPLANPISRSIASHSVIVMLSFFMLGGLAFLLKKPFIMLYTWMACVALCHFLKDTQHSPFYYAEAREETRQIQIGHFDIENKSETLVALATIEDLNIDLVSIQTGADEELRGLLSTTLTKAYPYQLTYFSETQSTLVFSKMKLDASDTFHCDGMPYLMSNLIIDSIAKRKLQFLSLHLPKNTSDNPELMMEQLSEIGACWSARQAKDMPLMAFCAIPMVAWSPEIRAFRNLCTLNDSRLDLELQSNSEHIFYSNQLRCLSYEALSTGIGVVGTYQLKLPTETVEASSIDHNSALTQR